jgi:hypothetical protein
VCRTRRTWLASGERQLVRSEASWVLCSLIKFSALTAGTVQGVVQPFGAAVR